MAENTKPVPSPTDATQAFWSGCASGVLRLRKCPRCANFLAPTRAVCACGNSELTWVDASGRGKIFSYTVVHRAPDPAFRAELPYVIAVVELEEGAKLLSNITGCAPGEIRIGMPVRAVFDQVAPGIGVPKFQPVT
ncbi:MAG: Zn-ribbon domain-containing OB-fold protein [Sulfuricaulis sp.]|nr:Zn-ribbon domain-containing OB-fold protein [Sulfuricaulis sp.]